MVNKKLATLLFLKNNNNNNLNKPLISHIYTYKAGRSCLQSGNSIINTLFIALGNVPKSQQTSFVINVLCEWSDITIGIKTVSLDSLCEDANVQTLLLKDM